MNSSLHFNQIATVNRTRCLLITKGGLTVLSTLRSRCHAPNNNVQNWSIRSNSRVLYIRTTYLLQYQYLDYVRMITDNSASTKVLKFPYRNIVPRSISDCRQYPQIVTKLIRSIDVICILLEIPQQIYHIAFAFASELRNHHHCRRQHCLSASPPILQSWSLISEVRNSAVMILS